MLSKPKFCVLKCSQSNIWEFLIKKEKGRKYEVFLLCIHVYLNSCCIKFAINIFDDAYLMLSIVTINIFFLITVFNSFITTQFVSLELIINT